jgi:hypothetical protein
MYVIESRLTGRLVYPQHLGKVKRAYLTRVEAHADIERLAPVMNPKRVDVVELSRSALAWLERHRQAVREQGADHAD